MRQRLEQRLEALLPKWESYTVVFHGLLREAEGGWSVNDSWTGLSDGDRESAIGLLRHRWEVFKLNYLPKAKVADLTDAGCGEDDCLLEVDCTAFATVRKGGAQ